MVGTENQGHEVLQAGNDPKKPADKWYEIGFHRPLGGMLFNLVFVFIAVGFGMLFNVWLIPALLPAAALGYQNMNAQIFGIYFTLFDIGIGVALQRFVAEMNIKDPKRSIKYISFFCWFQMFTGLVQVTLISVWVIAALQGTNLGYAAWFFLIYSTVQFPGMLWVFSGALQSYQQFHKVNMLSFLQTIILENTTRIGCIILGKWIGTSNPAVGEIIGITIGSIIGVYVDDFIAALIAARWLDPVLKKLDPSYRISTLFIPSFDKEVVKDCLVFGARVIVPTLIWPAANFIAINMMLAWMPNYAVYVGVYSLADYLSNLVYSFSLYMTTPISEAYNNGKIELTKYYIVRNYTWYALTGGFMAGLLLAGAPLLGVITGESYVLMVPMIQYLVLFKFIDLFAIIQDSTNNGIGHPEYNIILVGVDQGIRITVLYIMLVVVPSGWLALVWSLGLGRTAKWVIGYAILYRKFFKFKVNWWQTFVATGIAMAAEYAVVLLLVAGVMPVLSEVIGYTTAALAIVGAGIVIGPFLVFLPVHALAGGWDDESLNVFARAVTMSGPSKGIASFLLKIVRASTKASPLHARFPTDTTGVQEEIAALMETRAKRARA